MVTNPYGVFPLLKGWEYRDYRLITTLERGVPKSLSIPEVGFINTVAYVAYDAEVGFILEYQGADLQLHTIGFVSSLGIEGWSQPNPIFFNAIDVRPNPQSSFGFFQGVAWLAGFYGAPIPFVPTLRMKVELDSEFSTQQTSHASVIVSVLAITNKKKYIRSLRAISAIKDYEITAPLLEFGMEGFEGGTADT